MFYVANYESFPDSLLLAVNAGRCAISGGFYNLWMLIAAIYYFADFFFSGWIVMLFFNFFFSEWMINLTFNRVYPTVCECYYWGSRFAFDQGPGSGNPNARVYFSSCDESSMMLNSCIYRNGTVVYNKTCSGR